MSRPHVLAIALALLVTGTASIARAQTPEERARIERLERRYHELVARRVAADSVAEARYDTLRLGSILILTDSGASPLLQHALDDLDGTVRRRLGTPPIAPLVDAVIAVRFGPATPAWGQLIADGAQFVQVHGGNATRDRLAAEIAHNVLLTLALRGGMAAWRADVRLFEDPEPLWEATYIEMATASLPGPRRCYEGDLDACRYVLRLVPDTAHPPAGAAAGLGSYVRSRFRARANRPAFAGLFAACVERDDAEACVELFDVVGVEVPRMSTRAAGTVLLAARDMGGDGALARFFADTTAPVGMRLEAAAAAPLDSVLNTWRAAVLRYRPREATVAAGTQWLALVWTVVLTVLATRSTRWR